MFEKLKTNLAIKWLKQNNTPSVLLNSSDKIYLAVSKKNVDKLIFVYMLVCKNAGGQRYDLLPTTEVASFEDKRKSEVFYKTVQEVMNLQQKMSGLQFLYNIMSDKITEFKENTR